jgi:hypothetical protein
MKKHTNYDDPTTTIRLRTVTPGLPNWGGKGVRYFVVRETADSIEVDNRAGDPRRRIEMKLAKLPFGRYESSSGALFERAPEKIRAISLALEA